VERLADNAKQQKENKMAESFWSKFKATFGTQSQRKPGYSAAGLMGTSAQRARQAQRQRDMASLGEVKVTAQGKVTKKVSMQDVPTKSPSTTARNAAASGKAAIRSSATGPMTPPSKVASPTSRPTGRKTKTMDAGLTARKALGGAGGLSEDNAVMRRLKERAMQRTVSKMRNKK
jgi:hypothetical protein